MNNFVPKLQSQWDWRATGNFIGGGTGTGLYVFAALDNLAGNPQPWLSLLALALVASGLGLVLLEIGRPWRFINVIFHPQTSWMTREAVVAVPLIVARVWFWLAYRSSLAGGDAPDLAVATLRGINSWFLSLGHVLPVIILAGGLLLPGQAEIFYALAGLIALASGWLLKFTIVIRAAYTQGYALPRTPAREVRSGGGPGTKPGWS